MARIKLLEDLTPCVLLPALEQRRKEIRELIRRKERGLQHAPSGSLRVSKSGKSIQYYHRVLPQDTRGKYIRKSNQALTHSLAQKEYDRESLDALRCEYDKLSELIDLYKRDEVAEAYNAIHIHKKCFITPVTLSDEEFAKAWHASKTGESLFFDDEDESENITNNGERVRSKSELMIANALKDAGVPYVYESRVHLDSGISYVPDFLCMNLRLRKEVIWEHFGMMSDEMYTNKTIEKLDNYQRSGYRLGDGLIMTFESSMLALKTTSIKNAIEQYLL